MLRSVVRPGSFTRRDPACGTNRRAMTRAARTTVRSRRRHRPNSWGSTAGVGRPLQNHPPSSQTRLCHAGDDVVTVVDPVRVSLEIAKCNMALLDYQLPGIRGRRYSATVRRATNAAGAGTACPCTRRTRRHLFGGSQKLIHFRSASGANEASGRWRASEQKFNSAAAWSYARWITAP